MLLTKTVKIKWNPKNKKYYMNLGYSYTKMKDEFDVNVEDLPKGSAVKVEVMCDYCQKVSKVAWYSYVLIKKRELIHKDCCNDPKCTELKAKETLLLKYGVNNARKIDGVNEKIKNTNINKYGCKNPFENEEIKKKIVKTNIEKYGVPYSMQNEDVINKSKLTCFEKYGVSNYAKTKEFRDSFRGENSPVWKNNPMHERTERNLPEYRDWRKEVFSRDSYTCQCCGAKNKKGNGSTVVLNAHHIKNFANHKDLAFDLDNGITLCKKCHIKFHSIYGKKNNTLEQLCEFIENENIDEKIC